MFEVEGVVVGGARLGRKLGFPTANIAIASDLAVENGVYSSMVYVEGVAYPAMTNVGVRPSVDGKQRLLEAHLFGFEGDLYGSTLRVVLLEKIRDEKKFASVEELKGQIERDREAVLLRIK